MMSVAYRFIVEYNILTIKLTVVNFPIVRLIVHVKLNRFFLTKKDLKYYFFLIIPNLNGFQLLYSISLELYDGFSVFDN